MEGSSSMLSNLAGFLWRGAEERPTENQDLQGYSVDTQEDWVIVSKDGQENEEPLAAAAAPQLPSLNIECHTDIFSEGESSAQTLSPATEGAWCVAPPPCFTRRTPASLTTSSLEDLLIEHPSMSIYQRRRRGSTGSSEDEEVTGDDEEPACLCLCYVDMDRTLAVSVNPEPTLFPPHSQPEIPEEVVHQPERRREEARETAPLRQSNNHNYSLGHYAPSRTKRKEAKVNQKTLKRGQLERNNKAREYQARGKHQRRTHLMRMRYSGVCNDRRC